MGFGDWTQIFIFAKQVFHSAVFQPHSLPQCSLLGKLFTGLLGHHLGFDHGMSTSKTWLLLTLSLLKFKSK